MADRQYEISVLLSAIDSTAGVFDKTEESINDIDSAIKTTGTALTAFGAAMTAAMGLAVAGAADEETALLHLRQQVENNGYSWETAQYQIDGYINSLKISTKYSDDELIPALQKMLFYVNDLTTAESNLKLAMDVASGGMVDLETAVKLIGLAYDGNVEALGRWIPELKSSNNYLLDSMDASEKAEYALQLLQERFGGMTDVEMKGFDAQLKQLWNSIKDLAEDSIGTYLIPKLQSLIEWVGSVIKWYTDLQNSNNTLKLAFTNAVIGISAATTALGTLLIALPKIEAAYKALMITLESNPWILLATVVAAAGVATYSYLDSQTAVGEGQDKLNEKLATGTKSWQEIRDATAESRKEQNKYFDDTKLEIDGVTYEIDKVTGAWKKVEYQIDKTAKAYGPAAREAYAYHQYAIQWLDEYVQDYNKGYKAMEKLAVDTVYSMLDVWAKFYEYNTLMLDNWYDDQMDAAEATYNSQKNIANTTIEDADALAKRLTEIDTEYTAKKTEIQAAYDDQMAKEKENYKNAQRAKALIDGAGAFVKTLAEYGGTPWGWAAAAAIAVETDLQIKIINATQYARGVRNSPGGWAITGEEGPELIHLPGGSDVYTAQETAGMMGGGGINVNVYGNYILDDMGADGLADRIGDVILRRVRNERQI